MPNPHGSFIWYELLTPDAAAAGRFYGDVIGWTLSDFGGEAPGYRIFSTGETRVAGMMPLPAGAEQAGLRPGWLGYVGVDDVDATVARIIAARGRVHMPATDMPGVGRIAMVADPQGVPFYVMRGASEQSSRSFDSNAPGHCSWNELATSDLSAALAFYNEQFGWTKGDAMPMGEMGDYQFIHHADQAIGAMMTRAEPGPPPRWSFYFRVADLDAAARRAADGGGTIIHGPSEVPGGDHIVIATDPQGAMFSLVGKRTH
jgi:predicted enzyme related to lactoylglutathione lyase